MTEECRHGLEPDWCSVCKHGVTKTEADPVIATFVARYDGQCPSCDLPISKGQVLAKLSGGGYVHGWCKP